MQLSLNNISMRYGARILFEDVNTTFIAGRRYAITGPNGAGKSTLMKILTGEIDSEKGTVSRPKKMGVLQQDQFAFDAQIRFPAIHLDLDQGIRKRRLQADSFKSLAIHNRSRH